MMEVKLFEVRDAGTFMPVIAFKLNPRLEAERYLLARSGYGMEAEAQREYILVGTLAGGSGQLNCDAYDWGPARTMKEAHHHIEAHWHELSSGDVIDVEFILGESETVKTSEAKDQLDLLPKSDLDSAMGG